jgi:SAM-dependent methyltransferase
VPRLAVGLITCDRLAYTTTTLESFTAQHPQAREEFLLLHADDQSVEPGVCPLAEAHGFARVTLRTGPRRGARAMRTALVRAAAEQGADWIVLLENDWEWVRPFPHALLTYLCETHPSVYCLRLYGQWKERDQHLGCARQHAGLPGRPTVNWTPVAGAPERAEMGRIHWGAPPAATRMAEALALHADTFTNREAQRVADQARRSGDFRSDRPEMLESGTIAGQIARVVDNVVFHIGHTRSARVSRPPATPRKPQRLVQARPRHTRAPLYTATWQQGRTWTEPHAARCFMLALEVLGLPARLLDVGCGSGHLVHRATTLGVEARGVDLSIASGRTDGLAHADLREPLQLDPADLVLCWEVAEHLPAEAADVLCQSLVTSLRPGGVLLFTAARPGQGGQGHLNENTPAYWREKLLAHGLTLEPTLTAQLSHAWSTQAPRTPWYGANLQVFRAPGAEAVFRPYASTHVRIAITMRTANRAPKPNYVGETVRRLVAQGVAPERIHLCATHPDVVWLERELGGIPVTLDVPRVPRTPNQNGLAQIQTIDPTSADWILLLEDDLNFCADFLGSVERWIQDWARPNRHLYRLFGFRVTPARSAPGAYDDLTLPRFAGSQAVLLRMDDAQDFLAWGQANLETWGGFRGNAKIAFDKLLATWLHAQWPGEPPVMSHPLFVKHVGFQSSLHPKAAVNDRLFAGAAWSYGAVARA